jgi:hypothetical protein
MSVRIVHLYQFYKVRIKDEHIHHQTKLSVERIGPPDPNIGPKRDIPVHFDMESQRWKTHECYAVYKTLDELADNYIQMNPTLADTSHAHHGGMQMGGH